MLSSSTSLQRGGFGRRRSSNRRGLKPRAAPPRASDYRYRSEASSAIAEHEAAEAVAERFVARFNWWLTWVALGILIGGVAALKDLLSPPKQTAIKSIPFTAFDTELFIVFAVLMVVIGAVWLVKGLMGRQALVMTDQHVRGFTLFGTKVIRWQDISHVSVKKHDTYGQEIQIHATRGTPSSSIWLNCIPLYIGLTDRTAEDVLDAIRAYRADL